MLSGIYFEQGFPSIDWLVFFYTLIPMACFKNEAVIQNSTHYNRAHHMSKPYPTLVENAVKYAFVSGFLISHCW